MKLLKVLENAFCNLCDKPKDEVVEVEMHDGRKRQLCFNHLKKMIRMDLKEPEEAKV